MPTISIIRSFRWRRARAASHPRDYAGPGLLQRSLSHASQPAREEMNEDNEFVAAAGRIVKKQLVCRERSREEEGESLHDSNNLPTGRYRYRHRYRDRYRPVPVPVPWKALLRGTTTYSCTVHCHTPARLQEPSPRSCARLCQSKRCAVTPIGAPTWLAEAVALAWHAPRGVHVCYHPSTPIPVAPPFRAAPCALERPARRAPSERAPEQHSGTPSRAIRPHAAVRGCVRASDAPSRQSVRPRGLLRLWLWHGTLPVV